MFGSDSHPPQCPYSDLSVNVIVENQRRILWQRRIQFCVRIKAGYLDRVEEPFHMVFPFQLLHRNFRATPMESAHEPAYDVVLQIKHAVVSFRQCSRSGWHCMQQSADVVLRGSYGMNAIEKIHHVKGFCYHGLGHELDLIAGIRGAQGSQVRQDNNAVANRLQPNNENAGAVAHAGSHLGQSGDGSRLPPQCTRLAISQRVSDRSVA
jgi:hypothetical protein